MKKKAKTYWKDFSDNNSKEIFLDEEKITIVSQNGQYANSMGISMRIEDFLNGKNQALIADNWGDSVLNEVLNSARIMLKKKSAATPTQTIFTCPNCNQKFPSPFKTENSDHGSSEMICSDCIDQFFK